MDCPTSKVVDPARLDARSTNQSGNLEAVIVPRRRERPSSCPAPSQATASPSPAPVAAPLPKPPKPIAPPAHDLPLFAALEPINERVATGLFASRKNPENERHARRQLKRPGALEKTFREAFVETYGDLPGAECPKWSPKNLRQVEDVLCDKWAGPTEDLHDFVDWFVRDWPQTRKSTFEWMARTGSPAPDFPAVRFLFQEKLKDRLISAWGTRTARSWIDRLDDNRKRLYLDLTLKQGKSHEEAVLVMADVRAEAKLEEKMRQTRIEAARMQKAGELAQRTAERMQITAGRIHPKSEAARRLHAEAVFEKLQAAPAENLNPVSNMADFTDLMNVKFRED